MADEAIGGAEINETCKEISGKTNEDTCEINMADNDSDSAKISDEEISPEEVSADFKQDATEVETEDDFKEETPNCELKYDSELNVDTQTSVPEDDMETAEQTPDSSDSAEISVSKTEISKQSSSGSEESIASSFVGKKFGIH